VNFEWTDEQREFQAATRAFCDQKLADGDGSEEWFRDAWKKCAGFGIQGLKIAREFGGTGADHLTVIGVLEALGYSCRDNGLIFSLNAQMWACQHPIERFGTREQQDQYLPGLCDGSLIGAHAMSEPGAGSDAFGLSTTATPVENGFRLNGSKTFVTNAPLADVFVVFARSPGTQGFAGLSGFVIERGTPGLTVGPPMKKMGLTSSFMGEVFFDDCLVSDQTLLGKKGAGMPVFSAAMELERSMILAATIGTMQRGLERCLTYAQERQQFHQPIGKFQAVSHRLVEMKLRLETARLLLYRLGWMLDEGHSAGLDSALVKLHLGESFLASSIDALQVFGGYGYMVEYGLERDVRDAIASRIYSGTSDIQRNLAARHMGL
jgi:alkylation response protein AidB-like acyl-CoA dehydrogenase